MNGQTIDQVIYGSIANHDQSIVRFPEGENSEFVLHSSLAGANGAPFSPGTAIDGKTQHGNVIPEPISLLLFSFGVGAALASRRGVLKQKLEVTK